MSLTRGRLRGAGVNDLVFLLVLVIVHAGVDMVQSTAARPVLERSQRSE